MEENVVAKKELEQEEPLFTGIKLKQAKPVQREWKEHTLETVNLKDHKFEQIPQVEMVKSKNNIIQLYD